MWLGALASLAAFLLFLRLPELPLRRTTTAEEEAKHGRPAVAVA
jgi:hypothetical protein